MGSFAQSKGCRTCRRRHTKCDGQHPACNSCYSGGLVCEGYRKDLNFVDENNRAKRRSHKQERERANFIEEERSLMEAANSKSHSTHNLVSPQFKESKFLGPEIDYAAGAKNEIQISFTLATLFGNKSNAAEWLVWGYNTPSNTLNTAALHALSNIYFGQHHHDLSSTTQAHLYYSQVLHGIRRSLQTSKASSLSVLLASTTSLCYEMIASPSYEGIMQHAGGIGNLLELRGPERCKEGFEFRVFEMMRMVICIKALVDRKRCFLEREEWKTIPWSSGSQVKTLAMSLLDFLAEVGGLLQDFDSLLLLRPSGTTDTYGVQFRGLKNTIERFMERLSNWKVAWDESYPDISHEVHSRFPNSPFEKAIYYQDLEVANGIITYNALYIRSSNLFASLLALPQLPPTTPTSTISPLSVNIVSPDQRLWSFTDTDITIQNSAIDICKSIEYYISPPHEKAGGFFLSFPVRIAWQVLEPGSECRKWLEEIMRGLSSGGGFGFAGGVLL